MLIGLLSPIGAPDRTLLWPITASMLILRNWSAMIRSGTAARPERPHAVDEQRRQR
jgi:hypothetical protein